MWLLLRPHKSQESHQMCTLRTDRLSLRLVAKPGVAAAATRPAPGNTSISIDLSSNQLLSSICLIRLFYGPLAASRIYSHLPPPPTHTHTYTHTHTFHPIYPLLVRMSFPTSLSFANVFIVLQGFASFRSDIKLRRPSWWTINRSNTINLPHGNAVATWT